MTALTLLDVLADFVKETTKNIILQVRVKGETGQLRTEVREGETPDESDEPKTAERPPQVYKLRLPKVYEPKERLVMTNAFRDKVVQHSLCDNVLAPAFTPSFILDNYAGQTGKGTHFGLDRLTGHIRSYFLERKGRAEAERRAAGLPNIPVEQGGYAEGWVLKCDIAKYFYTIRHDALKRKVREYITDSGVLWLVDLIINSTDAPGIPIGNQTSQWFAVMYLSDLDHFITEKLGIKRYGRYMDDFYIVHEDKAYLQHCRAEIAKRVAELGLALNNKTQIFPLRNGIDFLGFHTYITDTGKVVRKVRRSSKRRLYKRFKYQRGLLAIGEIDIQHVNRSYQSWRSHAAHGNSYHLIRRTDKKFGETFKESEKKWRKH